MCHECQKWQPGPWQPEPEQSARVLNPPQSPTKPLSDYVRCYIKPTPHNYPCITYIGGNLHNRDEPGRVLSPPLTPTEPCDLSMDQYDWWYKATSLKCFPLKAGNVFPIYTPDCISLRIACATATLIMLKDHHLDYDGPPPLIIGPWMLSKPGLGKRIRSLISLASTIMDAFDKTYKDYLTLDDLWRMCKADGDTIEEEFLRFWAASSVSHQKVNRTIFEWLAVAQDNPHLDMCMPCGPADIIMEVPPETAKLVRHVCGWLRKINARSYFAGARVRVPVSIADKVDQPGPQRHKHTGIGTSHVPSGSAGVHPKPARPRRPRRTGIDTNHVPSGSAGAQYRPPRLRPLPRVRRRLIREHNRVKNCDNPGGPTCIACEPGRASAPPRSPKIPTTTPHSSLNSHTHTTHLYHTHTQTSYRHTDEIPSIHGLTTTPPDTHRQTGRHTERHSLTQEERQIDT